MKAGCWYSFRLLLGSLLPWAVVSFCPRPPAQWRRNYSFVPLCAAAPVATSDKPSCFSIVDDSDDGGGNDVLASLLGSARGRDRFLREDEGRNVVHVCRSDADLQAPLEGVSMEGLFESSKFINLRRRGSIDLLDKSVMKTYADLEAYIATGGSAVVCILDQIEFQPLKEYFEVTLGRETSLNVYHSGQRAVALNRHYDAYDVFVLQLEGEKEWEVEVPISNDVSPTAATPGDILTCSAYSTTVDIISNFDGKVDCEEFTIASDAKPGSIAMTWANVTMIPGDVLYIPQGIEHAATTASGFASSTHVTIGFKVQ